MVITLSHKPTGLLLAGESGRTSVVTIWQQTLDTITVTVGENTVPGLKPWAHPAVYATEDSVLFITMSRVMQSTHSPL